MTFAEWVAWLAENERGSLAAAARREGLGAEDALDVVQEAFGTLLRFPDADRLVGDACASGRLLRAIVRNAARNRRKRHFRQRPHDSAPIDDLAAHEPTAEEQLAMLESYAAVNVCMAQLGETQRQVLRLRVLEEEPGEIVAELLGTTPGHVAVLLHRARRALRECMS